MNSILKIIFTILLTGISSVLFAQTLIQGQIKAENDSSGLHNVQVHLLHTSYKTVTDSNGFYYFPDIPQGKYKMEITSDHTEKMTVEIEHLYAYTSIETIAIKVKVKELDQVTIEGNKETFGITRLKSIEGTAIYEGKKNEVIVLKDINANLAINSTRQIYAKVPGINIWESDAAGIQLGIGVRGLDPNRTSNFNTRQNGYDMTADALGYPESYYVPPAEALERIEVIRGAASLQYGPQFGGMLNYVFRKPPPDKKIQFSTTNTIGAYGLFNTFNSLGGTVKRFSYFTFFQYKTGKGWRPNTGFDVRSAYIGLGYKISSGMSIKLEYTYSSYLNQQPGGLTDAQFDKDPKVSLRSRNWFKSDWNILALIYDYKINSKNTINVRNWGFLGDRYAIGFLDNINRSDNFAYRDMIADTYKNFGSEGRYLRKYVIGKQISSFLVGYRYYQGYTTKKQGRANNGSGPDFTFLHPDKLESSDFSFPGKNIALFTENIFTLSDKLTITPGLRYEFIDTRSNGYYSSAHLYDTTYVQERRELSRHFLLLGLGVSWYAHKNAEVYYNISQNYRGITFTDMRVSSDAYKVDPNLKDESGYNMDLGCRGTIKKWFNYDISGYLLVYNDRIGFVRERDSAYNIIRYTRNIGASRSMGVESFFEIDLFDLAGKSKRWGNLVFYTSAAYVNAIYTKAYVKALVGNKLEFAPEWMIRPGINFRYKKLSTSLQMSYITMQYTDASNTKEEPTAVVGTIPAYYVCDWSMNYSVKMIKMGAGINNFTNNIYFTRRAASYPGPGIIPAEPRTFYISLGLVL